MNLEDRINVLIVDDHRKTRRALIALLTSAENIQIVGEASDGAEALARIQMDRPHVVLMDLQMPTVDGFQATLVIKKKWPEVKVIALTQFPGYREAAIAAGTDYFLLKGDRHASIQEIIHNVLHETLTKEG